MRVAHLDCSIDESWLCRNGSGINYITQGAQTAVVYPILSRSEANVSTNNIELTVDASTVDSLRHRHSQKEKKVRL
jgi:hypothetical protein